MFACGEKKNAAKSTSKPKSTPAASDAHAAPAVTRPIDAAPSKPASVAADAGETVSSTAVWNLDAAAIGRAPTGTKTIRGSWKVERAPDGKGRVLVQRARSPSPFFNLVLFDSKATDVDLRVRLKAISGRIDQGGGLVWRARDADNYYIARYNPLEDNYRLYRVVAGRRKLLASATTKGKRTEWRELRCVARGDLMQCYLDGARLLEHRDTTFTGPGYLGVWTKADAVTIFDALTRQPPKD